MKVLIVGNGSIGKQHTISVLKLGHTPIVVTQFPDNKKNVRYTSSIDDTIDLDIDVAIICTPTDQHLNDFLDIINKTNVNKILIEKPVTSNSIDAEKIQKIVEARKIEVYVAFDMRFIPQLQYIKNNLNEIKNRIRLVKIHCGQYLPDWRPNTDYRLSYSSNKNKGGGVDLDLTHEIDYMQWLFGLPSKIDFIGTYNISSLEINSPDYFKGIYNYTDFIIDVELDYFRKLDRKLTILGENEVLVELDFIKNTLIYNGDQIYLESKNSPIIDEDCAFLKSEKNNFLCSLNESIDVLKLINK